MSRPPRKSCGPPATLFDSAAVSDVLLAKHGILSGPCNGKTIIDMTTNHVERVKEFHSMVGAAGGTYLEAPVLGSVIPASQGALTILVSGPEPTFRDALPLLQTVGKTIHHFAEPGKATVLKLINNMVLGSFMATLAESVALAERAGIPRAQILEVLAAGAGNSAILTGKRDKLAGLDFSPHFSVSAIVKDLRYLSEFAAAGGKKSDFCEHALRAFTTAAERGFGAQDLSAVYRVFSGS
jgi:3-hydroxyisobutyrate dehydrogenase